MLTPEYIRQLLPFLIGLPILVAVVLAFLGKQIREGRRLALGAALLHLALTALVVISAVGPLSERRAVLDSAPPSERHKVFIPEFVPGDPGMEKSDADGNVTHVDAHVTTWNIVNTSSGNPDLRPIQFFIGLDGLNIWLLALTSLMMLPVVIFSWDTITERQPAFFAWLFAMQGLIVGVFLAFDIILFYVCFELTLIPLFFLISQWGIGPNRREAARKLFLFTLAGGLITLVGIAGMVVLIYKQPFTTGQIDHHYLTFSIPELAQLMQQQLESGTPETKKHLMDVQLYLFIALSVGFAVKIPLVPLHSWLPGAYSEAPMGVTVMLSALLAKMGTFGLLRICLPLAPDGTLNAGLPIVGTLGALGIVYGAFCAFAQSDFKKLVAYSSVSHLGFCALALVAFNAEGIAGGTLHMVNHGLTTGAMFLLVGMLLTRYTSQQMSDFSGMWAKLPVFTFFMITICLASVGLPGLNNFISEMLMLCGLFDLRNSHATGMGLAAIAGLGIFLSAWYILTMIQRVFFGPLREPLSIGQGEVSDVKGKEWFMVVPLVSLCLLIGIAPQLMLDTMKRDVDTLARIADDARRGHTQHHRLPRRRLRTRRNSQDRPGARKAEWARKI
jgi:NADH-quinone oxidoreductase subunit M